jgi:hypothetical protein
MSPVLASWSPEGGLALGVGSLALVILSLALLNRWQQGANIIRSLKRDDRSRGREQRELLDAMRVLAREIDAAAGRLNRDVDDRREGLAELIRAADERLLRRETGAGAADARSSGAFERVDELLDDRRKPAEIARELSIPLAEIELRQKLREYANRPPAHSP